MRKENFKISSSRKRLELALAVYRPNGTVEKLPAIVMAHGIGCVKEDGLEPFAEAFTGLGLAAITFDYLHFGQSDGEPRQLLNVGTELQDVRDVISWVRQSPDDFDISQVIVWGTSFGGMHVTALLAEDHDLLAGIAQCPCVDGYAASRQKPILRSLRIVPLVLFDVLLSLFNRGPIYVHLAGDGSWGALPALMEGTEVVTGWRRVKKNITGFSNDIAARSTFSIMFSRPVTQISHSVRPYLVVVPSWDNEAPLAAAKEAASLAPFGELVEVPGGHFDLYRGGVAFEKNLSAQVDFLKRIVS